MQTIPGFVPTGQVINCSARAGALSCPSCRRRVRPVGRSLAGFLLLLLGFLLILFGSTISASQNPAHEHLSCSLSEETIATVATLVGRSPADAVQRLWQQGIHITDAQQSIREIAADNGRSAVEVLSLLEQSRLVVLN